VVSLFVLIEGGVAVTRREIREHLFLMLFRKEFHDSHDMLEQVEIYLSELREPTEEEASYLTNRFQGIQGKLEEVDDLLSATASGWTLGRMGKVELTILRLAIYEMRFDEETPIKVAINEAVELAKIFGGDDTPGFINGVLAKLA
jgi:N utilization substance protein B